MINTKKMLVASALLSFAITAFAADFSAKSNEELLNLYAQYGSMSVSDTADLRLELMRRADKLQGNEKKSFMDKMRGNYDKATESWSVSKWRSYRESVNKEYDKKRQNDALAKQAKYGSLSATEAAELRLEIHKITAFLDPASKKTFQEKLTKAQDKAIGSWTMKQYREYRTAVNNEFKKLTEKMPEDEKKRLGITATH